MEQSIQADLSERIGLSNTISRYLKSLFLIIFSLGYFYKIFMKLNVEKLWEEGMFCFNTSLLIYYSGTMLMYLSSDYLWKVAPNSFTFFIILSSQCVIF